MKAILLLLLLSISALGQGGMGPGPGTPHSAGGASFSDNFNRSDRALNGDNGWAFAVGSTGFDIVSNELQIGTAAGDNSQVNSGVSIADGYVEADIKLQSGSVSVGLIFRYQDASNFYLVDIGSTGTDVLIFFYKREAGSYVLIDSTSPATPWTNGTYATIRVNFSGSTITVNFNTVLQDTYTDSTFSAAGLTGIRNGSGGTGTRTVDNFTAVD